MAGRAEGQVRNGEAQAAEDWAAWRQKCALDLCPPATQTALRAFAEARFRRYACAYARDTNTPDGRALTPAPREAWHWFETHLRLRNTREGKSYKAWLLSRTEADGHLTLDSIQAGATLLMRDVVREYLRREYSPHMMVPLDAPAETSPDGLSTCLHELLPGPLSTPDDVARKELESLAAAEADSVFGALPRRERVALLARELGVSLAHPAVTEVAACGKSVLATAYRMALQSVASHVRSRHPRDDRETMAALSVRIFEELKVRVLSWGKSENGCARLFSIVEG